jgi:hypothetical protein
LNEEAQIIMSALGQKQVKEKDHIDLTDTSSQPEMKGKGKQEHPRASWKPNQNKKVMNDVIDLISAKLLRKQSERINEKRAAKKNKRKRKEEERETSRSQP